MLRLRSTRSLWDPTYADESWIADVQDGPYVRLIPRMRDWVNANYPGTKLAVTEYNWGGLESINGALAQADVLGIFGREGLDLATIWGPPSTGQPVRSPSASTATMTPPARPSAKPRSSRRVPTRTTSRFTPRCALTAS